jgi:predicted nucleic acid-binding protein
MITPSAWLSVVPVDRAILVRAASLGPSLGLKLPDAIHVASATATDCDVFLSNDGRIKVPAGMALVGPA